MYIVKNALRCIGRSKGRNILIGIITLVIALSACLGLSIRQAAESAKEKSLDGMSITATISYDRGSVMEQIGGGGFGGPNMGGGFGGGFGGLGGDMPSDIPSDLDENMGGFFESMFGNTADYISEVDSAMNLTVVVQMLGVGLLLTIIAGAASVLFIMRYDPLKILANRD